jgi:hypothetical protein
MVALGVKVDGVLLPQALEIGPLGVGPEELRVGDVDLVEGDGIGPGAGFGLQVNGSVAHDNSLVRRGGLSGRGAI